MSRYVEVFWTPWYVFEPSDAFRFSALAAVVQKPKPALNVLQASRSGSAYLKCPAVIDLMQNTFIIEAPFDLNVTIDRQQRVAEIDRYGQEFFDKFVLYRDKENATHNPSLLSLPPRYLFYTKEPVMLQTSDLPIITSSTSINTRLIPGIYNIGKWVRPVDWTVEVLQNNQINMKRGDPLFAIRFITKDNIPVKLTRVEITEDLVKKVYRCADIKTYLPGLKLKEAYEYVKDFMGRGK